MFNHEVGAEVDLAAQNCDVLQELSSHAHQCFKKDEKNYRSF